jgi:hypothetical protein
VNRKEYTVGLKVFLLLIVSAAWAVSIEFPSLGFSHPNYPSSVHMSVGDLKSHERYFESAASLAAAMSVTKSEDLSEQGLGEINPFPHVPGSGGIAFPLFGFSVGLSDPNTNAVLGLSPPNTNRVDSQPQDLTSHPTSSSNPQDLTSHSTPSLSEFYLKKPHE